MIAPRDSVGQRSETVRRSNLSAIVRELHLRGPLSRSDLVAHTGLTRSAIRGLIGELGVAEVLEREPGVVGRLQRDALHEAGAADLVTLFVFYEVLTLSTWPLVTHHQDEEARRGGRVTTVAGGSWRVGERVTP